MAVREYKVETPSSSQEIRGLAAEIVRTGEGSLEITGVLVGDDLASRRGDTRRTFQLEILHLQPGSGSLVIEAQDIAPETKQWLTVYETKDGDVHVQVAE